MTFKNAFEIGAGDSSSCILGRLSNQIENIFLFEPNPILRADLIKTYNNTSNIIISGNAIGPEDKVEDFYNFGYASFLKGADSFVKLSYDYDAEFYLKQLISKVIVVTIDKIDNGNIDLLLINCNGSEMFVLDKLVSRPLIINTKYYVHNAKQWNHYNKITAWMEKNKYKIKEYTTNELGIYFDINFCLK